VLVVPGGLGTVTGGNLYDRYITGALERGGWSVEVVEPGSVPNRADIVIVDSLALADGLPTSKGPVVALIHQLPSQANRRPDWADAEAHTLSAASMVITVADHLRASVASLTGTPVEVIPPGRDQAWAAKGARLDSNVVLCVANAIPGKGVPDVIEAFTKTGIADAELVVVGDHEKDSEEARNIEAEMSKTHGPVRLLGVVEPDVLSDLYASARLFVTASRYEGWPIAVAEAMASGLPVIGLDAPGVNELVRSGTDGMLVPVGDVASLSGALSELFEAPGRAGEMGRAARDRALVWPTWETTGRRFAEAMQGLLT
jgi:glycosyltransferase involved in cell wall biosynthesis